MYLEEHVAQIDQKVVMHDQQIEILSKGLADLTLDVRSIRDDMTEGFKRIDARFDKLEQDIAGMKQDITGMKQDIAGMKQDIAGTKQDITGMQQDIAGMKRTQESMEEKLSLIVKLLTNRV